MFVRLLGIALGTGLLLNACGDDSPQAKTPKDPDAGTADAAGPADASSGDATARYVGEVEGTDVRVAVLSRDERLRMFFCGGDSSFETATRWFTLADVVDGETTFDEEDWHLEVSVKPDGVRGSIARGDDETRAFSAEPVAKGTLAGLYEGYADCGRMGLIVSQPTRAAEISAQGACVGAELPKQVNPIMPIAAEDGKIPVHTPGVAGETSLLAPSELPL